MNRYFKNFTTKEVSILYLLIFSINFLKFMNFKNNILFKLIFINKFSCPKISNFYSKNLEPRLLKFNQELKKKFQGNIIKANSYLFEQFLYLEKEVDNQSKSIINSVFRAIIIALNCNIQTIFVSPIFTKIHNEFEQELRSYKQHFKVNHYFPEVFWSHHGLRFANKKILNYVYNRDILDIGAYSGDSLLVLLNYTKKKVCSYEYSPANLKLINYSILSNKIKSNRFIIVNKGIGNHSQIIRSCFTGTGSSTIMECENSTIIEITTIDKEVNKRNLTVGFIKADIEGMELQALQGARRTIERDRPIISFSIYHNFECLFGIRKFIENFPDYAFQYHMGSWISNSFGELIIFAYPKELS